MADFETTSRDKGEVQQNVVADMLDTVTTRQLIRCEDLVTVNLIPGHHSDRMLSVPGQLSNLSQVVLRKSE